MENLNKSELTSLAKQLVKECLKQNVKVDCWSVKGSGSATKYCDIAIDVDVEPTKLSKEFTTGIVLYSDNLIRLKFVINEV